MTWVFTFVLGGFVVVLLGLQHHCGVNLGSDSFDELEDKDIEKQLARC